MFELFDPEAEFRITRGSNLPHWYQPGVTYFVTFRTEDSLPTHVARHWHAERARWLQSVGIDATAEDWRAQFAELPKALRREFHETYSRQFLEFLDRGWGECVLRRGDLAAMVADSLLHFDGQRYYMGDFVVMPNHVHLLVCLIGETGILDQCYSWKRYTALHINKALGRSGRFWQEDSFDHLVRSPEQFDAIRAYIARNPQNLREGEYHLYRP